MIATDSVRLGTGGEEASAKRRRGGLAKVSARLRLTVAVGEVWSEALVRHPTTLSVSLFFGTRSHRAWLKAARLVRRAVT